MNEAVHKLCKLQGSVECSCDNVVLLLLGKLDEVYSVSGYTDSKLRIVLGMLLSIEKCISCEHVNVEVVTSLDCITVKKTYEIVYLLCICCHSKNSFQNRLNYTRLVYFLYAKYSI